MIVKIEKLDNYGRGITYINDKIVFVEDALPDEEIKIKIIKETKKYIEAQAVKYIKTSNKRKKSECPYSEKCGGCNLEHISFQEENNFKVEKVTSLLKKYAEVEYPIHDIKYHERNYYRNKIILHGKDKKIGLYEKNSNNIVQISKCMLVNNKINEAIDFINKNNKCIKEAIIKTSNDNKNLMIKITGNINNYEQLKETTDVLIINDKYYTEKRKIITNIGNKQYYQSINSFFQINNTLTEELYNEILNIVKEKHPNKVLDLYCGCGTIGIYISDYCDKIIGIDYNESNIIDATNNKELNKVNNIEFINSKVEDKIEEFDDIDLIIVDPPRAGLDIKTRKNLKRINAKIIIYVSCDPITLSRDLNELKELYNVSKIKLFNMFPKTYHVESVSVLERKSVEK